MLDEKDCVVEELQKVYWLGGGRGFNRREVVSEGVWVCVCVNTGRRAVRAVRVFLTVPEGRR